MEMKKGAERLARQRTEADVAARGRGETVGLYFSIHKYQDESLILKPSLGEEELVRGNEQDRKGSREVEARGRVLLPKGPDPVAVPALASSNQKWMHSKIGGGASGILTPAGHYNKRGR